MALTPREHAEERARTLEQFYLLVADLEARGEDCTSVWATALEVRQELIRALRAMPWISGRAVRVGTVRYVLRRGELVRQIAYRHLRIDRPEPACGPMRTGKTVQRVTSNSHASRRPYRWRGRSR